MIERKVAQSEKANHRATLYWCQENPDPSIPPEHQRSYESLRKRRQIDGKKGAQIYPLITGDEDLIFIEEGGESLVKIAATLTQTLRSQGLFSITWSQPPLAPEDLSAFAEAMFLSDYKFDHYRSDKKSRPPLSFFLSGAKSEELAAFDEGIDRARSVSMVRDLVNTPANHLFPEDLATFCERTLCDLPVEVTIYEEDAITSLGMTAYLSVAKGSDHGPRLIVLSYQGLPDEPDNLTAFIGKGLTFDTGGYSLKTKDGMLTMKSDMGGAGAVIGALRLVAENALPVNIVGVIASCENMISGGAYRPGDIISSMAGKSIFVKSTDAEGRLTLADALTYAQRELKAQRLVDIATLTGGQVVALGQHRIGSQSNDDAFHGLLEKASQASGEGIWRMPVEEAYAKLIDHHEADLSNSCREASMVTAGMFLHAFVEDERPWIHLDIAGPAFSSKKTDLGPKGATGAGVRLLYALAKELCEQ